MIRNTFKKILDGMLYGIGFSVPFCAAFYLAMVYSTGSYLEDSDDLNSNDNYGFTVIASRVETIENDEYVIGSIQNTNADVIRGVGIEAEFYDSNDTFINKCSGSISGNFKPDEKRNFKLKCKPTNSAYERYQVKVTGAYAWNY